MVNFERKNGNEIFEPIGYILLLVGLLASIAMINIMNKKNSNLFTKIVYYHSIFQFLYIMTIFLYIWIYIDITNDIAAYSFCLIVKLLEGTFWLLVFGTNLTILTSNMITLFNIIIINSSMNNKTIEHEKFVKRFWITISIFYVFIYVLSFCFFDKYTSSNSFCFGDSIRTDKALAWKILQLIPATITYIIIFISIIIYTFYKINISNTSANIEILLSRTYKLYVYFIFIFVITQIPNTILLYIVTFNNYDFTYPLSLTRLLQAMEPIINYFVILYYYNTKTNKPTALNVTNTITANITANITTVNNNTDV